MTPKPPAPPVPDRPEIEKAPLRLNGAQALLRVLLSEGVDAVYGIVGGKLSPFFHALSQEPALRFVGLRHEAAGPMMAAATYAGTGKIAVAVGELGPGGLNLAAGLGVAFNNNIPLLAITTNQHRASSYPHLGVFMDMDTRAVVAPLTKWNAVVNDGRRLPELARRAFREALSGRPGPVHLDIPQDVLGEFHLFDANEFDLEPKRYRTLKGPRPAATLVGEAAALLRSAERPLIVGGGGAVAAGAAQRVRNLAKRLNAPVVPTQMGIGLVPSDSASFIGQGGIIAGDAVRHAFQHADVILSVGCRWSSWMWDERGALARRSHKHININIDPSALGQPALHEVAMHADANEALGDILTALDEGPSFDHTDDWLAEVRAVRAKYEQKLGVMAEDTEQTMHPAALAKAVADALPKGALVVRGGAGNSNTAISGPHCDITPGPRPEKAEDHEQETA
ncbi:MAG: thiamine pyrophosphate-binding protein [Alcaligenaceae bacterium]|nr:MAG: thiamine pyrophosphate-binding protein [Alcaligenaceae bacterium]